MIQEETNKGIHYKRGFTLAGGDTVLYHKSFSKSNGWNWIEKWSLVPYRVVFINPKEKKIFTYCEGDTCLQTCDTPAIFHNLIKCAGWYYKQDVIDCRSK